MFINVGHFRFRDLSDDDRASMVQSFERDIPPILAESQGFRGVYFTWVAPDDLMAVWLWDREQDWDAAFPKFGPSLQENVIPHLAGPPDRASGMAIFEVSS